MKKIQTIIPRIKRMKKPASMAGKRIVFHNQSLVRRRAAAAPLLPG
jgi:hypothetical protein